MKLRLKLNPDSLSSSSFFLYQELARRLISTFKFSELRPNEKKEIEINPEYLQRSAKEFIEKMLKGEFPIEIEENELEEFHSWLNDKQNYTKIVELVSVQMENLLVESLLFYFDIDIQPRVLN